MTDCLEILKRHQQWRTGDDDVEPTNPRQLSVAIHEVIAEVERLRKIEKAVKSLIADSMILVGEPRQGSPLARLIKACK